MSSLLVAAIDFGTTYSGWAFSFYHDYKRDPIKVSSKNWTGGQLVSQKAPTCILIKPDGKTLHSFGYDAETKYVELAIDKQHKEWYFFKRFKMMLYGRIGVERNIELEDACGKKLPAKTVFVHAIRYLKEDLINIADSRIGKGDITNDDIHWVLTVPAIWNDPAKQFMREAAEEAGICRQKLTLCLEPEAASLFCRHLPLDKMIGKKKVSLAEFAVGTRYLVLDAGGGTVDITMHEVIEDNKLKEVLKASGGDWGGTKVDDAFECFLGEILGKEIISQLKEKSMEDYIDLFREFEIKKRETSPNKDTMVTFRISVQLSDLIFENTGRKVKECVINSKFNESLVVTGDKLRIDMDIMSSLFERTINQILDHVEGLLNDPKAVGCSAIVMVGGFSESHLLQNKVRERFDGFKIIIPEEAGLAVLKGAVLYGHNPTAIAERICKFTYGEKSCHLSSSRKCNHPPCRKKRDKNGDMRCEDIFRIYARIGQSVKLGEEGEEKVSYPVYEDQTRIGYHIYASTNPDPFLVTEPGCIKLGHFRVNIRDTTLGTKREFGSSFLFGDTEIQVKVTDKVTGETTTQWVDFLG